MGTPELVDALLAGQRRALARLLTRVEDGSEADLREVVRLVHPHTGSAHHVGMTGSPGVGKSTLTNALVSSWRASGLRVAVLAVDPTSPFSGGALLGDRVRMQDHALDDGVFIRSMASRGHLGGLSWAVPQALLVLDAAGFDVVVVETVGVGQAEVEVASLADTTVVAVAPGMGDAVQAAKAGILEVADVLCVNKADREGADRTVRELREMQRLGGARGGGGAGAGEAGGGAGAGETGRGAGAGEAGGGDRRREVPIVRTVASTGGGVAELVGAIAEHRRWLDDSGLRAARRLDRARMQLRELALGTVRKQFATLQQADLVEELAGRIARLELDPYTAADELVAAL